MPERCDERKVGARPSPARAGEGGRPRIEPAAHRPYEGPSPPRPSRGPMNVLLIGSGGREHALALALSKSPRVDKLFAAPGNPGIGALAENVAVDVADHGAVIDFCRLMKVEFVVVGPE